tara:strand:+ start:1733 stop:2506 length:774 start_codon:yes stop_codon:yes gene_type:complete
MDQVLDTKLKKLLTTWPQGTVLLSSELNKRGIGYDLQNRYRNSGWIKSIGQGAVVKTGDNVTWQGAVYALQKQGHLPVHVGAKTALELYGLGHYLNLSQEKIQLFGPQSSRLPKWFSDFQWNGKLEYYRNSLFSSDKKLGIQVFDLKTFSVEVSSPERAFMELLLLVPNKESLKEAFLISEGLTTLRPSLVQKLLEACTSIKVKRLFLYMAEKQNHQWFKRISLENIDLGKGDRQIIKGGQLDPKYRITVPRTNDER